MNRVQQLMQHIHANDTSTAPVKNGIFVMMVIVSIMMLIVSLLNILVQEGIVRLLYAITFVLFAAALVMHIVYNAKLKKGLIFEPQGLRYRSKKAIPWQFLAGAQVHPKLSAWSGREVLLVLTPEGVEWVKQNKKGFLRLSKTGHGVDAAAIRGWSPQESAFALNETIRLYRHRHGLQQLM
ncbi:MAG: hypothetical protein ACTHYY_00535 [Agrococcus casei]